jgi:hypothetical protein
MASARAYECGSERSTDAAGVAGAGAATGVGAGACWHADIANTATNNKTVVVDRRLIISSSFVPERDPQSYFTELQYRDNN